MLEPSLTAANEEFTANFYTTFPEASEDDVYQAGRAIHRTIVAALLDKNITAEEFRKEVTVLINGYFLMRQATSIATASPSVK
jgi:hypothetical protein